MPTNPWLINQGQAALRRKEKNVVPPPTLPPPKTPEPPGATAHIVNHGDKVEAARVASELVKLHRDGAFSGPGDPNAVWYAALIRDAGASYLGKDSNVRAAAGPFGDPAKAHVPTAQHRVPRGLSKAELQRALDDAIAYEPTPEELTALPATVIDLTAGPMTNAVAATILREITFPRGHTAKIFPTSWNCAGMSLVLFSGKRWP